MKNIEEGISEGKVKNFIFLNWYNMTVQNNTTMFDYVCLYIIYISMCLYINILHNINYVHINMYLYMSIYKWNEWQQWYKGHNGLSRYYICP